MLPEALGVGVCGDTYKLEAVGVGAKDVEGLFADAASGTQDGYTPHSSRKI